MSGNGEHGAGRVTVRLAFQLFNFEIQFKERR